VKRGLLDVVACPLDGAWPLALEGARTRDRGAQFSPGDQDEVDEGFLRCLQCGTVFPIVDGIPALLPPKEFYRESSQWADQTSEQLKRDEQAATHEERLSPCLTRLERALTLGALRPRRAEAVLEVGAGTGRLTAALAGRCREVVALDFSLRSLQLLRARVNQAADGRGESTRVHAVQADLCFLPLRANAFSKCLAGQVLQHLPGEGARKRGLAHLARVLRPGAVMAVSVYNHGRAARGDGQARAPREGFHAEGAIYYYRFERAELARLLEPSFSVQRMWGFYTPRIERLRSVGLALNRCLAATPLGFRWGQYLLAACTMVEDGRILKQAGGGGDA